MMLLWAALLPALELFDRWDPPGLSNDTEFAAFAIVFAFCLALLVCLLVSSQTLRLRFIASRLLLAHARAESPDGGHPATLAIPPLVVISLRI